MDFLKTQNFVMDYIRDNYGGYLSEFNIEPPFITSEFIDFDRFKKKFVCFVDFESSTFSVADRYNDDCSKTEKSTINIFLAFREDTPTNLNDRMLNATTAFYNMNKEKRISNIISSNINRVDFFKYIEGNNNIFSSKLTIELFIEEYN